MKRPARRAHAALKSVSEICHAMGVELTSRDMVVVGAEARDAYEKQTGRLPEKALRPKATGRGSHCFAVYPEPFVEVIVAIIRRRRFGTARQRRLDL